VYVSDNGGPIQLWLDATTETSDEYEGLADHTYRFYSVATDNVGYREAEPPQADAETTVGVFTWHNSAQPYNVDGSVDGVVSAIDALLIINYINEITPGTHLPAPPSTPPPYYDVDNNGLVSANDVLQVINYINYPPAGGDGEGEALQSPPWALVLDQSLATAMPNTARSAELSRAADEDFRVGRASSLPFRENPQAGSLRHGTKPVAIGLPATRSSLGRIVPRRGWGWESLRDLESVVGELEAILPDIATDIDSVWCQL
jgi:hypothetical protein